MMRATIKFYNNSEFESDPTTATFIQSNGNYTTLDETSIPPNLLPNLVIDKSTPGQFIIDVTPTIVNNEVVSSSVDNLKTIMSNIGVLPPIDYSTNSGDDIRVQIQVQAKEAGAEFSAPSGGDFTLIVNPVASQPTISGVQATISGLEDELPDPDNTDSGINISKGIVFNVNDADGSESIVAVNISGVLPGYALVDVNNNAIGVSDGAGTVTLTNVQQIDNNNLNFQVMFF